MLNQHCFEKYKNLNSPVITTWIIRPGVPGSASSRKSYDCFCLFCMLRNVVDEPRDSEAEITHFSENFTEEGSRENDLRKKSRKRTRDPSAG